MSNLNSNSLLNCIFIVFIARYRSFSDENYFFLCVNYVKQNYNRQMPYFVVRYRRIMIADFYITSSKKNILFARQANLS